MNIFKIVFWGAAALLFLNCSDLSTNPNDNSFNLELVPDSIYSNVVSDTYSLYYHLPQNYDHNKEGGYPVIYLLDGAYLLYDDVEYQIMGAATIVDSLYLIGLIPECIVVGIGYKYENQRIRDFLYPYDEINADSGGGDKFYLFLRDELIPFVDGSFNSSGIKDRTLVGYSSGGYAVMYAMFQYDETEGAVFENYLAGSPRLYYHDFYILEASKICFQRNPNTYPHKFYMAQGDGKFEILHSTLMTFLFPFERYYLHPEDQFKMEIFPDVNHAHASEPAIYNGLIYLFDE